MKTLLTTVLLFFTCIVFSQNLQKEIELPKIDSEIEFSNRYVTALFDIYVKKNGDISLKDSLINRKDIGDLAFKFNIKHLPILEFVTLAALHIDKDTPYKYVDEVKNQLNQSRLRYFYRTNNFLDPSLGFYYQIIIPTLFEKTIINDSIKTIPRELANYNEIDVLETFLDNLYCHKYKKAKLTLKKLKYTKIEFLKNNYIRINNKKKVLTKSKEFEELLRNSDICFSLYKPDLLYKDYLNNLYFIRKTSIKLSKEKVQMAYFFEVSKEINSILLNKIKI